MSARLFVLVLGAGLLLAPRARAQDAAPGGRLIDNGYVEPRGLFGAYGAFDVDRTAVVDSTSGMAVDFTTERLQLGGGYGITDHLTAGLQYGFPLAGDNANQTRFKGPLAAYAMYSILHRDRLVLVATADFTADFCGTFDLMGSCAIRSAIDAGVDVRYAITPELAVYSGEPFGPGPVGQQLAIDLDSDGPVTFGIPVGAAVQPYRQFFAYLQTEVVRFNLANAGPDVASVIGAKALGVPLTFGAFDAVDARLNLGLQLDFPNLEHAGDFWDVGIVVRWYQ